MQNSLLQLKEIIWEITGKCQNGCTYCGSKENWNEYINENQIIEIAQEIAKYPPEQIDISGGDPLLVSPDVHQKVTKILKDAGVMCKVLLNPKSLSGLYVTNTTHIQRILGYYSYIGVSVNTEEELSKIKNLQDWGLKVALSGKMTIISNFNVSNVFMFDDIYKYICTSPEKMAWQIQLTVYNDPNDELALYNNDKAFEFFKQKVSNVLNDKKINIYISDNMNDSPCGAGRVSIGILSDGHVVPCLSMRSWVKNVKEVSQGNLLLKVNSVIPALQQIWEGQFQDYRFREFKCCKDHCKNKCVASIIGKVEEGEKEVITPFIPNVNEPNFVYYAVAPNQPTYVYAVRPNDYNPVITMYAVRPNDNATWTEWSNLNIPECGGFVKKEDPTLSDPNIRKDYFGDIKRDLLK